MNKKWTLHDVILYKWRHNLANFDHSRLVANLGRVCTGKGETSSGQTAISTCRLCAVQFCMCVLCNDAHGDMHVRIEPHCKLLTWRIETQRPNRINTRKVQRKKYDWW